MNPLARRPPSPLAVRLLRLEYWFDRLSEPQRLLVGLAALGFFATCWLYVLGLGSIVLVSRTEEVAEAPVAATPLVVIATAQASAAAQSSQPSQEPTSTPTA